MITDYELERLRMLVKQLNGRHSDTVLKTIMKEFSCGPVRASHMLHEAVDCGVASIDGLKVRSHER